MPARSGVEVIGLHEKIRRQVECRVEAEAPASGGDGGGGIDSRFIRACLEANELGDGVLYGRLQRGRFCYCKSTGQWLRWAGHHWEIDKMDRSAAAVEDVVLAYLEEVDRVSAEMAEADDDTAKRLGRIRKALRQRVRDLRARRRRANCLEMAHTCESPIAVEGEEIDTRPYLLPCANGVLDLRTGELRPGRHEDFLLKACAVSWEGIDAPCDTWRAALLEIFSGNESLYYFLQRLFGFALIGEVLQSVIVVLTGQGRNGKSMIVNTICDILGPLAKAIRSEMLLDQGRTSNSAGPTPDIMSLKGSRFCFGSETDDGCRISPSRVKWLTGNDILVGRNPHDKYEVEFRPSHTLFLLTNHVPNTPPDDFAFWERVLIVPFDVSFVNREPRAENERRADARLPARIREELPGILAWMVRGCLKYQADGLRPPPAVIQATADKRRQDDLLADFVDECCVVGEGYSVGAAELYSAFEKWWIKSVSKTPMKQKKFGTLMQKRFDRIKSSTYKYLGIGLMSEDPGPWDR